MGERLTVCCPGPSFRADMTPKDGPVGAINTALNVVQRCDFWICYDTPVENHTLCVEAFRRMRPTVVTLPEYARGWQAWFHKVAELQLWQYPSIEVVYWEPLWFEVAIKVGPRYSASLALAWAMARRFRKIHYLGCDMGGMTYCEPATISRRNVNSWTNRWVKERMIMKRAQDGMRERGYELTGLPWDRPGPA